MFHQVLPVTGFWPCQSHSIKLCLLGFWPCQLRSIEFCLFQDSGLAGHIPLSFACYRIPALPVAFHWVLPVTGFWPCRSHSVKAAAAAAQGGMGRAAGSCDWSAGLASPTWPVSWMPAPSTPWWTEWCLSLPPTPCTSPMGRWGKERF